MEKYKKSIFLMHKQEYVKRYREKLQAIQDSLKMEFKLTKNIIVVMRLRNMMKNIFHKVFDKPEEEPVDNRASILAMRLSSTFR